LKSSYWIITEKREDGISIR